MTYFVKADRQLLNPNWTNYRMLYSENPTLAVPLMKAYNNAILDVCGNDSQFDGNMWLALQDFDASMEELETNLNKNFFGIVLTGSVNWPFIEQFCPLFEKCAQNKIPVTFHIYNNEQPPLEFIVDTQNPHYQILRKQYAFLGQTHTLALAGFITSGMLDQLPDLRILIPEVPARTIENIRKNLIEFGYADPLPYFKKNFWFTVDIEEPGLFDIVDEYGWDRFLFATDYPHSHDVGGANRFKDVDMINDLLQQGKLSQENYDLLTHKNYDFLKNRK
jgi:predicted TIM-barrel fold metal-dependent hydrolase